MDERERKSIMILAETIQGEINRMCVTKRLSELDIMHEYAQRNLDRLLQMIYAAKFKSEGETNECLEKEPKTPYISIENAMSVFDDFMCDEVDEDGRYTFLEMLKDKAESEE